MTLGLFILRLELRLRLDELPLARRRFLLRSVLDVLALLLLFVLAGGVSPLPPPPAVPSALLFILSLHRPKLPRASLTSPACTQHGIEIGLDLDQVVQ